MSYTSITIGRMTLRETFELNANISAGTDTQTLVLSGEESYPPLTLAQVKQRREDILGLQNRLVPIRFGTKSDHDGWYRISDVNTAVRDYQSSELRAFGWGMNAEFIGPENAVDLESRLTGVARINDFGLTGDKWHAPAVGEQSYYTGGTLPSVTNRTVADGGTVHVYRSLSASTSPRWAVSLSDYQKGRARVYVDGVERVGTNLTIGATASWVIENGLVSASMAPSASATWNVAAWDGSTWDSKGWNLSVTASSSEIESFDYYTIIRNDYEAVTLRSVKGAVSANGRHVVDLTLRRGSRFVEGYATINNATTLYVIPEIGEASTSPASSGYVRATSNDAQGNRYVVGSARSFTANTGTGGFSKGSARTLDFFIGAEVAGSAAVSGDAAADLVAQYLTAMSEVTLASVR